MDNYLSNYTYSTNLQPSLPPVLATREIRLKAKQIVFETIYSVVAQKQCQSFEDFVSNLEELQLSHHLYPNKN